MLQPWNKPTNQEKDAGMHTFNLQEFEKYLDENSEANWIKEWMESYRVFLFAKCTACFKPEDMSVEIPGDGKYVIIYIKHKNLPGVTEKYIWLLDMGKILFEGYENGIRIV